MTNERTYQIIIGVLVLVIIIGGWYLTMRKTGSDMQTTTDTGSAVQTDTGSNTASTDASSNTPSATGGSSASTGGNTMTASGESVSVVNQPAGSAIAVASVSMSQPGWVAVRDSAGRILGAGWFPAGMQMNVSVPLLRATESGQRYQVLLYVDNGDKQFDLHSDTLLTNADGSVAGTMFTAN